MKNPPVAPPVRNSLTVRATYQNTIGTFARIAQTIGKSGGDLGAVDIVSSNSKIVTRDIVVRPRDAPDQDEILGRLRGLSGVEVIDVLNRVFLLHLGGRIASQNKVILTTRDALSMAYTPGVALVCEAIADQSRKAWRLTFKSNLVAPPDAFALGKLVPCVGRMGCWRNARSRSGAFCRRSPNPPRIEGKLLTTPAARYVRSSRGCSRESKSSACWASCSKPEGAASSSRCVKTTISELQTTTGFRISDSLSRNDSV